MTFLLSGARMTSVEIVAERAKNAASMPASRKQLLICCDFILLLAVFSCYFHRREYVDEIVAERAKNAASMSASHS